MIRFELCYPGSSQVATSKQFIFVDPVTARVGETAVTIIHPQEEARLLPRVEPSGKLLLGLAVQAIEHSITGKRPDSRGREIEQCDK